MDQGFQIVIIWHHGRTYSRVDPDSMIEEELDVAFLSHAHDMFPEFVTLPFKQHVHYGISYRQPDLIMISKHYDHWYVVEIEKSKHSLDDHVIPQVQTFLNGVYTSKHAERLMIAARDVPRLDLHFDRMKELLTRQRPEVLVVSDSHEASWEYPLRSLGVGYLWMQIFRHIDGDSLISLSGQIQDVNRYRVVAECRPNKVMPSLWEVSQTDFLDGLSEIEIYFQSQPVKWQVVVTAGQTLLAPQRSIRVPLNASTRYQVCEVDGRLKIQKG